jgi:hypothetical protein
MTHDYTQRYWGHDFAICRVEDGGNILRCTGWGDGLEAGDYMILPNEDATTRYQIELISYHFDPGDMWRAVLRFAPREVAA